MTGYGYILLLLITLTITHSFPIRVLTLDVKFSEIHFVSCKLILVQNLRSLP